MSIFGKIGDFFDDAKDFVEDKVIDPIKDAADDAIDFIEDEVIEPIKDAADDAIDFVEDEIIDPVVDFVEDGLDALPKFDDLLEALAPPKLVDAQGVNISLIPPNSEADVVVLIHGWQSNYQTFEDVYGKIQTKYPDKQVFGLDWSALADLPGDPLDFTGIQFIPTQTAKAIAFVAETITAQLQTSLDVIGGELTLIGHSLGSLVASEIGRLYGAANDPVKQLVALDPAAFAKDYDLDGRGETLLNTLIPGPKQTVQDFNKVAQNSLALVVKEEIINPFGGIAGDNRFATTAKDSFLVDLPDFAGPAKKHNAVISVFGTALATDYFSLEKVDFGIPPHVDNLYNNFGLPNLFGGAGHEGILTADIDGTISQYLPKLTTQKLTNPGTTSGSPGEQLGLDTDAPELGNGSEEPFPDLPDAEDNTAIAPAAELLDLTGVDGELTVNVTLEREAGFDNLLRFYATDALGTVDGILPGEAGYEDAVRQNLLASPALFVENGAKIDQAIALTGGTYYAPALLVQGQLTDLVTLDDGVMGMSQIQREGNVWKFEDWTDFDFNDLVLTVTSAELVA